MPRPSRLHRPTARSAHHTAAGAAPDREHPDAGFTLVEIVMAIVLSSIIGGVLVAALTTSMNAAEATSSSVANSVDEQLISAFLTKDAQAAGGVDPLTADVLGGLGVSTVDDTAGWAGCTQPARLLVRFAWVDRSVAATNEVAVTYGLRADGSLVRRACQNGTSSEAVLGRSISSAIVRCEPSADCVGLPDAVTLTLTGGSAATPFEFTVRASLRPEMQRSPTLTNSAQVPVVLSGAGGCPALDVGSGGSGSSVFVLGDLVVDDSCGITPIAGDLSELDVTGSTLLLGAVTDPLSTLTPPASCTSAVAGTPMLGSSTGPDSFTIYSAPVTISGPITFLAGRHVFCGGLTLTAGAELRGTGVMLYSADGGTNVDPGATVSITPATSGEYAGISLWSAGADDVVITSGATVHEIGGTVYAPDAHVVITSTSGIRIGSLVADRSTIRGTGPTRFGSPSPTLTVAATGLPPAVTLQQYATSAPRVTGGTPPYTYRATGLPSGLSSSRTGDVTGVASVSGTAVVSFVVTDATGASVAFTRTLDVTGGVPPAPLNVVATPGEASAVVSWAPGAGLGASPTTAYVVTATATSGAFPTRSCTVVPPITTCVLDLTNGVTYAVAVTATNASGTSASSLTTVTPRPNILADPSNVLWLDAADPDADGRPEGIDEQCNPTTTCASTGNVLTRWEDKSGSGNDAVQNTASMAGRYVSSLPAVDFDANGFYTATVPVSPDMTVFVVAQSDRATWNTYGWLISSRRPNGVIIHPWPGGGDVGWYPTNSAGAYLAPASVRVPAIMSPHIYELSQRGSNPISMTAGLDGHLFADGVLSNGQTRTSTSIELRLGADDLGRRYGDGKYREVIFFRTALDAQQRRSVHEYLARRWNIAITPSSPTNVVAAAGAGSATVTWTAPTFDGGAAITGSRVTAWPGGATCTASAPTSSSCTVTGLNDGAPYVFIVNALNAAGASPASAASNVVRPGPPPPPTSPNATSGDASAVVSWTAPVLDGHAPLLSYTVTAIGDMPAPSTCSATHPATSCTVTGLTNGVTYQIDVRATNAAGTSVAASTSATPVWTPGVLGEALTWWYDASSASSLTGGWVTQSGFTVSGTAGSTRLRVSTGIVERVDVLSGGTGYTTPPTITISGGGGSSAAVFGTTVANGAITSTMAQMRGTGHTSEPAVTVGGPGTGARLRAVITAPVAVGSTIRVGAQTYTVTDRDGLVLTVTPALATDATAASVDEWQVSTWSNQAGPGVHDARQTTVAEQPTLGTMAGRPAVVFDGVDSWMWILDNTGSNTVDRGPNWTVLVAYQAERQVGWGAVGQTGSGANTRIIATSGTNVNDAATSENIEVNPWTGDDARNGGPVRIQTDSGIGADTFDWNRAFLGATATPSYSPGWGFAGRVGEILVVKDGLDSTAVAKATAYLTAKWSQSQQPPSAPITLTPTPGDGEVALTWRGANQYLSPITGYTATASAAGHVVRSCTTASLGCTVTGLTNGAVYSVTVTATNGVGPGPASLPVTVVPRPALLTGANARIWLDAADIDGDGIVEQAETGVTGATVRMWTDRSGRANHAFATSTTAPAAAATTMNGLPVITFNGATVLSGTPAANPYGITGDRTMFVVTRRRSGTPSRLIDRAPENNPLFGLTHDNTLEVRDDTNGQYRSSIGTPSSVPGTPYVITARRSGDSLDIWANGSATGNATFTGMQTMRAITIGRHVAWSRPADVDVAEVIVFDRDLTVAERRQVEEYLRLKWALTITPGAPTGVSASSVAGAVTVSWTASTSDGGSPITGYTVTASNGSTCSATGASAVSCTFSTAPTGTTPTFTVVATNAVGTGTTSVAVSVTQVSSQATGGEPAPVPDAAPLDAAQRDEAPAFDTASGLGDGL